ncbi:serine hydrolase domain-containing protein [Archangium lipolyticum]|uniref:serine hydrolase domain-containing protein n=1 Tax=Archangium lipolyticum TaxID=2970465 RepID=UPI002149BD44|nr:serine hydrolase domain-containing protein [Archangium lipolyticum]
MVRFPGRSWSRFLVALSALALSACVSPLGRQMKPVEALLREQVDSQKIPGAVVLLQRTDGSDSYVKAIGHLDREKGAALREDALFRIASMTKPITSVAVMMLVEEGKLGLDEPISKYLPEWQNVQVLAAPPSTPGGSYSTVPAQTPITVKQLLTHTSGISYRFMGPPLGPLYQQAGITDGFEHTSLTLADQSRALAALPLEHQPGAAYSYGLNTDLLGYLVEQVSGVPLDRFFQERLFTPLGMKDTYLFPPEDKATRMPALYRRAASGALERVPETGTNVVEGFFTYAPDFQTTGNKGFRSGGAGLVSTASDYSRFLQMMANGGELGGVRLLKKETVEQMTRNQIGELRADFVGTGFGLGFAVQEDPALVEKQGPVGSYFWSGIFKSHAWVDPQNKLVGVIMVNMWDQTSDTPNDIFLRIYSALKE